MDSHSSENPFASPLADPTTQSLVGPDVEKIRREYLSHEASIQSVGFLYLLGGGLSAVYCIVGGVALLGVLANGKIGSGEVGFVSFVALLFVAIAWFQLWVGIGLRRLKPEVKTPATVLAAIGLIGIPIGTLISAYILWLIHSAKGKVVLSYEYQEIIRQTPHIKYKTSIIVWILLGLLLLVLGLAVLAVIVGSLG